MAFFFFQGFLPFSIFFIVPMYMPQVDSLIFTIMLRNILRTFEAEILKIFKNIQHITKIRPSYKKGCMRGSPVQSRYDTEHVSETLTVLIPISIFLTIEKAIAISFRTNHHLADLLEQRTTSVRVFGKELVRRIQSVQLQWIYITHIQLFFRILS